MSDSSAYRYVRQTRFEPIGQSGQRLLQAASVTLVGCGALGTVAAEILARAGVGRLRIIDRDVVQWSNLQRQSLFDESHAAAAKSKAAAAAERLAAINSQVDLAMVVTDLTPMNIQSHLAGSDLVIDATDNFAIRFLLNDWSLKHKTAWVHGGCVGATGQIRLFDGLGQPCFRCLVPTPPPSGAVPTCDTAGVVGSATYLIASLQATEAIKWLTGNRKQVRRSVLSIDLWENRIREIEIPASLSVDCPACRRSDYEFLDGRRAAADDGTTVLCGRGAVQIASPALPEQQDVKTDRRLELDTVARRWSDLGKVQQTAFFVRIDLAGEQAQQLTLFRDGRVIVDGTEDPSVARAIRDRYLG